MIVGQEVYVKYTKCNKAEVPVQFLVLLVC